MFLTLVMTLNAISLMCATLVINIKKKGDLRYCPHVPARVLRFCRDVLGRVTCTPFVNFYHYYGNCDEDPTQASPPPMIFRTRASFEGTAAPAAAPTVKIRAIYVPSCVAGMLNADTRNLGEHGQVFLDVFAGSSTSRLDRGVGGV